jgi:hypothetical protein
MHPLFARAGDCSRRGIADSPGARRRRYGPRQPGRAGAVLTVRLPVTAEDHLFGRAVVHPRQVRAAGGMRPSSGAAPPARGTAPLCQYPASLVAPRFAAFSSLLPAGLDAFVPAGMETIVSSQLGRDDRAAAGGWLSRRAARRLVGGKRRRGVHPQRGDGVLRREAQRQRDQHRSQV